MTTLPKLYFSDKILAKFFLPFIPRFIKPNHITVVRFLTTPLVLWFLWKGDYKIGLISFVLVAFTDALDGALARTRNQITDWGKMYDPLADKLLVCSVIYLIVMRYLNFKLALAIISLEIIIILSAVFKKSQGSEVIQANWWGKIKMICQVAAVSFLLVALIFHLPIFITISSVVFAAALFFGFMSLFTYSI